MPLNAYEASIFYGLTGTDTQILNQLASITDYDISSKSAVEWLAENGYWQEGPTGMAGTLVPIYVASTGNDRKKFDDVWYWLFSTNAQNLKMTKISQSSRVQFVINQIPGVNNSIRTSFYALGGGRLYNTVTEQQFADQRTAYQDAATEAASLVLVDAAYASALNSFVNAAVADLNRTKLTIAAALRLAADQLEV